ncbi:MAG: hypothetical protein ABH833_04255 [Parcubacteria group bacterium]
MENDFEVESLEKPSSRIDIIAQFLGKHFKLLLIILILVILAWILTFGRKGFSSSGVVIEIESQDKAASGEIITYTLKYENNNNIGLSDVDLSFIYPKDSLPMRDGKILSADNVIIHIDKIGSNKSGEEIFQAMLIGDKGDIETVHAKLRFRPDNLNVDLIEEIFFETEIDRLIVPISIAAPPTVVDGQTVNYFIDYQNESDEILHDLRLIIKYPEGFTPLNVRPQPNELDNSFANRAIWNIARLVPDAGERITIEGIMHGSEREEKRIIATLQREIQDGEETKYVDFQKIEESSVVSSQPLVANIEVNGSRDYVARLGDNLNYKLEFTNNSGTTLTGVVAEAKLEGRMYDLAGLSTSGFFDSRTDTITWDASSIAGLGLFPPGQTVVADFNVNIKSGFVGTGLDAQDSLVKVRATIETSNVPEELGAVRLYGDDELVTRISTQPSIQQILYYSDSAWGVIGPHPPRVDEKTSYVFRWKMLNPINKVSPARVSATLEPGVSWEYRVRASGGANSPSYDNQTQTITWDLGILPGGLGSSLSPYEIWFQVSITPSVNQIGSEVPLLKDIKFEGKDIFTDDDILLNIRNTTTRDVLDSNSTGYVMPALQ